MINKNEKMLLQITLRNSDYEKLLSIKTTLINALKIDLSKSDTIAYLINNFDASPKSENKPKKANRHGLDLAPYIKMLKDRANASYTELGQMLEIPPSTLKKYASGTQQPKGENEQKILNALKRYGLK